MAYLNVTEVESGVKGLAKAYKALTELISLPNVTHEGRTSHALRIGTGSAASRDGVLIIGGVHAREWGSCEICLNFAADLLEAYTQGTGLVYGNKSFSAKHIKTLVEGWNLYVFPLVNPDGRHYSQTVDNWWRKNRRPGISACVGGAAPGFSPACTTGGAAAGASLCATGAAVGYPLSCEGVDINRNYDFLWNFPTLFDPASHVDLYTSTDPCHDTYHGPSPFSEPETKNVRWLLDAYPRIKYFVDIHSYSELILYTWGDDQNQTADPAMNFMNPAYNSLRGVDGDTAYKEYIPPSDLALVTKLANHMHAAIQAVRGKNYTVEQSYSLYPTSGTSDDYVYSRHVTDSSKKKVLGFTIEWGTEFQPRWREMEKIILDITAGLIEFGLALPRRRA